MPKSQWPLSLWEPDEGRSDALMQTFDEINARFGPRTIQVAVAGLKKTWSMRQGMRSNRWTTNWNEIPVVRA